MTLANENSIKDLVLICDAKFTFQDHTSDITKKLTTHTVLFIETAKGLAPLAI